jgi:hypothetical protein
VFLIHHLTVVNSGERREIDECLAFIQRVVAEHRV